MASISQALIPKFNGPLTGKREKAEETPLDKSSASGMLVFGKSASIARIATTFLWERLG